MIARTSLFLTLCLTLAACGADGAPTAPQKTEPGITISGDAQIGVVVQDP